MDIRDLTLDELALVSGGHKQTGLLVEFPPPKEPEIPPLPGLLPVPPSPTGHGDG